MPCAMQMNEKPAAAPGDGAAQSVQLEDATPVQHAPLVRVRVRVRVRIRVRVRLQFGLRRIGVKDAYFPE